MLCILPAVFGRQLWFSSDLDLTHACYHKHKWSLTVKHLAVFAIRNASLWNICYFLPSAGYHSKFVFNWHLCPIETGVPPSVWAECHSDRWTSVLVCWRANICITCRYESLDFYFTNNEFENLAGLSCLRWEGCTSAFQSAVEAEVVVVWSSCLALVNQGCCSEGGL